MEGPHAEVGGGWSCSKALECFTGLVLKQASWVPAVTPCLGWGTLHPQEPVPRGAPELVMLTSGGDEASLP